VVNARVASRIAASVCLVTVAAAIALVAIAFVLGAEAPYENATPAGEASGSAAR
jgi:hypothetical protein